MRILHVITAIQKAAGTSVFVGELSSRQAQIGHKVSIVYRVTWRTDNYQLNSHVKLIGEPDFWKSMSGKRYDILHIHGLWEPMLHRFAKYARKNNIKVIWSPHGGLTKWAMHNRWWKKLPIWYLYQKRDLQKAAALHVTAQSEVDDVKRLGFTNNIIVAPLGVEISEKHKKSSNRGGGGNVICKQNSEEEGAAYASSSMGADSKLKKFSFIGRVHPIKNLSTLIKSFHNIRLGEKQMFRHWKLRIVGPDQEGHTAELKELVQNLRIEDSVEFVGPKYDDELKDEYRNADCFVLPSHSENFGSVVIESLAAGVPVITTKGTPWQELEEWGCGKWVDISEVAIEKALVEMMKKTDAERQEMGRNGVKLVKKKYSWAAVCDSVTKGYEEVLKGGEEK